MSAVTRVDNIRFKRAPYSLRESGVLGFVRIRLDGRWAVDGITVRETADQRHAISFPSRRDGCGIDRPIIKPLDPETRAHVENEILNYLRSEGWLS